jgi:hypothetical protein
MKTSELSGAALDWAVHQIDKPLWWHGKTYQPSTDWSQGGPIIERERLDVHCVNTGLWSAKWWANNSGMVKNPAQRFKHNIQTDGPTLLIAAMRCYVASKLGNEVEIPEELT